MINEEPRIVYFEPESGRFYYIEWTYTGNNDIPQRIYLDNFVAKPNPEHA